MKTKNVPLIIAAALPVLFIIVVALFTYIPRAQLDPKYDFIYTTRDYAYYGMYKNEVAVVDGKIVLKPNIEQKDIKDLGEVPPLFKYDVAHGTTHSITFADVQKLSLDPGPSSPDGYTVEYDYGHDGIFELFGSNGNRSGIFIGKNGARKRLSMSNVDQYYSGNFRLIGWVK